MTKNERKSHLERVAKSRTSVCLGGGGMGDRMEVSRRGGERCVRYTIVGAGCFHTRTHARTHVFLRGNRGRLEGRQTPWADPPPIPSPSYPNHPDGSRSWPRSSHTLSAPRRPPRPRHRTVRPVSLASGKPPRPDQSVGRTLEDQSPRHGRIASPESLGSMLFHSRGISIQIQIEV